MRQEKPWKGGSLCNLNLSYRDALWPQPAYRLAWDALSAVQSVREAARTMVGLLALAHDQSVEGELAREITEILDEGKLPDLALLRTRFTPATASAPVVLVQIPPLALYDNRSS